MSGIDSSSSVPKGFASPEMEGWRELLENIRWAFLETWQVSRRLSCGLLGLTVVTAVSSAALPVLVGKLADLARQGMAGESFHWERGAFWLALIGAIMLLSHGASVFGNYCQQRLSDELRLSVSTKSFEHAVRMDLSFFEENETQDIFSRATQHQGGEFLSFVLDAVSCVEAGLQIVTLLGVLLWIDVPTTVVLAALGIPLILFRWHISRIRYETQRSKTTKRRWIRYYLGKLANRETYPAVRLMSLGPLMIDKFRGIFRELMDVDRAIYGKEAIGNFLAAFIFTAGVLVVVAMIGHRALAGNLEFSLLIAYLIAAFRFRNIFAQFGAKLASAMERILTITHLRELLAYAPGIQDGTIHPASVPDGAIEMKEVSFGYPGSSEPVLRNISLQIAPGETVAVVGPNGAGKTSLVKLICRLYDVDEGTICLDGRDVRDYRLEFLHKNIAYVDQNSLRFEATVHENIAYGDWRRLLDQPDEVRKVAERTGIGSFVQSLPMGFETQLGRMFGSYDLSGGQWQKIAIARALARNASIYILDEPTAHMDIRSEYEIYSAIRSLLQGKTVILISHRFSSAQLADRVIVLDEGTVVEQGTHRKLVDSGGLYQDLFRLHSSLFSVGSESSFLRTAEPDR